MVRLQLAQLRHGGYDDVLRRDRRGGDLAKPFPMKTCIIKNLYTCLGVASTQSWILPVLMAALGLMMLAGRVTAQTFTTLYSFSATSGPGPGEGTNSDGAEPFAGLTLSGNTLYGTASGGGSSGNGTVFAVDTDGTGFTILHTFTAPSTGWMEAGLILSGNTLYGTAWADGSSDDGTVFAINTDGTGFTDLYSFTTRRDGDAPEAGLILSGNTLYGTTVGICKC